MDNLQRFTPEQLISGLIKAIKTLKGISDDEAIRLLLANCSWNHFHDGSQSGIAWNDVQAIEGYNDTVLANRHVKLAVPETATEGYNQHHHTSDYDGGVIPGLMGVHDHRDNDHGGFCYCVFHPSTAVPQLPWES